MKENQMIFRKEIKDKSNQQKKQNNQDYKLKKEKIIKKIAGKYEISYNEAEQVFTKLEQKHQEKQLNSTQQKPKNLLNNDDNEIKRKPNANPNNETSIAHNNTNKNEKQNLSNENSSKSNQENKNENTKFIQKIEINKNNVLTKNEPNDLTINQNKASIEEPTPKNVDTLLSDIIPDYNKQTSIELHNVNLTFEVTDEKVDTIKELFIRTLEGKKTEKIKIHALKDITFNIYKGEKVGIIGYNGAGKSTLLNVISGIYPPDDGYVKTNGNISPLLSLGAGFDYNYSGRKNIYLNGAVLGYDRKYLESKIDEIIEFSELEEYIDIPIKNYSSGMLAKLGFSIATAVNPDILIIDEILGVGDVNFQKKSSDKIKFLMDSGTTVLFVSHSIPQVRTLCDKAIWIDHGEIKEIGEVNKICDMYLEDAEKASKKQLANIQFR